MTLLSVPRLLVGICFLCLGWIACGDGGSNGSGALANLTDEELDIYNTAIDNLSLTAGFEVIRPRYLPPGTDWLPSTDYIGDLETAVLQFFPPQTAGSISERPVIYITQDADPNQRHCPPCPGLDSSKFEQHRLGDTELVLDQGRAGESAVFLSIYFRRKDVRVTANFDWQLEPGMPLTVAEDMRAEALKVVESMIGDE